MNLLTVTHARSLSRFQTLSWAQKISLVCEQFNRSIERWSRQFRRKDPVEG